MVRVVRRRTQTIAATTIGMLAMFLGTLKQQLDVASADDHSIDGQRVHGFLPGHAFDLLHLAVHPLLAYDMRNLFEERVLHASTSSRSCFSGRLP